LFRPGCSPLNRSPSHLIPHPLANSAMARIASQRLSKRTFSQGSPGEGCDKLLLSTSTPTPPPSIAEWGRGGGASPTQFFSSQQPFRSPDSAMFRQPLPSVPPDLLPHRGYPPRLTCAPRLTLLAIEGAPALPRLCNHPTIRFPPTVAPTPRLWPREKG